MPRGAPRSPNPQSNRSDLLNPPPQAITTVPDQGYGKAADQAEAQQIAPMSGGGAPTPPSPGGPAGPPPQGGQPDLMAMAAAHNGPGSQPFTRPTERPNEPLTHGLPGGPGAGPEALTGVGAAAREGTVEQSTLKNLLTNLSAQPNATTAVKALAALAGTGQM